MNNMYFLVEKGVKMAEKNLHKLKIFQTITCIVLILGAVQSIINYAVFGMLIDVCRGIYYIVVVIVAVILLYCICKLNSKLFLRGTLVLLLDIVLGIPLGFIWILVFSNMVPMAVLLMLEVPKISAMVLCIFVMKKRPVAGILVKVNYVIWGIVGVTGVIGTLFNILYNLVWGVEGGNYQEIIPGTWMIGCFGLFYTYMRLLFIFQEDSNIY